MEAFVPLPEVQIEGKIFAVSSSLYDLMNVHIVCSEPSSGSHHKKTQNYILFQCGQKKKKKKIISPKDLYQYPKGNYDIIKLNAPFEYPAISFLLNSCMWF